MILLIDNGSLHVKAIKDHLKSRKVSFYTARPFYHIKTIMKHRYKGVILSGGPLHYGSKIRMEAVGINFAVLLDLDVPILGICFGMQSIAEAFLGHITRVERHNTPEVVRITKRNQLFRGVSDRFVMQEFHTELVKRLPYNFEVLARSKTGIEAIRHRKKPIYGVQFHPEVSGTEGEKILDNFLVICGEKVRGS